MAGLAVDASRGATGTTTLVSVDSGEKQGKRDSFGPSVSADGRFVAFESASRLVARDGNGLSDVFVRDLKSGRTFKVSRGPAAGSFNAVISSNGRFVAFDSDALNRVRADTNGYSDIFLHNRSTGTTRRVSIATRGVQGNSDSFDPAISADGQEIVFWSYASNLVPRDANSNADVFVRNRKTNRTTRVSVRTNGSAGNGGSYAPAISARGRFVAFDSYATNLVAGDSNDFYDVFVRDRVARKTVRVSVGEGGKQGDHHSYEPAISANGRVVAFWSRASNLVAGDTNDFADVFVRDLDAKRTARVSVASDGGQANDASFAPAISADGRYVAFWSFASNIVGGDTNKKPDVFVHDRVTGLTVRVSVSSDDAQGNGGSFTPAISDGGRVVVFESVATDLVGDDKNGKRDIFSGKWSF